MNYPELIGAVARRAGVPFEQAPTITRAALKTLAERISGGEARQLAEQLPDQLEDDLRKPPWDEFAESFSLEEFTRRVSERAGVDTPVARAATRTVLTTLREAVTTREFDDMVSQLPKEYREVIEQVGVQRRQG
ncbi:DUF2267 domain-containing protein [Micromonospora sp. U21]|uniref:DUF2267 domain-containing protein n=1 Tax=Micromonospora sp. U21 TaxID=2824899 RepID=UPI001B3847BD|nr:DUF2267 domain-containing protein [Micromonospora sp. U21]MBQ0906733.1 DUF2267 domain-containing protein [Micromonospora sp. U21]